MQQDMERVQRAVESLGEHFETVHIFCTKHEPGDGHGTFNCSAGSGNWFARFGQIKGWTVKMEEQFRIDKWEENDDENS